MNVKVLFVSLFWPWAACAQGFAGLGTSVEGFAIPQSGYQFQFPTDHSAHPDFRIEWWYVTANLKGDDGTEYGIQWTLFRSALAPYDVQGWDSPQVWLAHAALTTPDAHFVEERRARGGIGIAGAGGTPFRAALDEWSLNSSDDGIDTVTLTANGENFGYNLQLDADGPLIFHGRGGYSVKSASGQASYYYSQPFYEVTGTLSLPQGDVSVTGNAWLDREWSSQPLASDQRGWDWVSLHFDDDTRLMGFQLRDSAAGYTSATWIAPDGSTQAYADGGLQMVSVAQSAVAERTIPTTWRVTLPDKGIDVTITALNPLSWMATSFPYWEGPVNISGTHTGRGYLEMTGY